LKYADVSEVVGLLSDGATVRSNDSFMPREPGFGSPGSNTSTTANTQNQTTPDDKPLGQPVDSSIAVDRRLNAIWVRGSPEHIARVKAQIAQIDLPLTSVLLETEFVELTESGAKSLGFDFTNASGQTGVATVQTGQYIPT
jgi:general secretion pathway protein D